MLDIQKIMVQVRQNVLNHPILCTAHAFHCSIDARLFGSPEQVPCKRRLAQAFPARQSKPPAGTVIVGAVLFHRLHDLFHRYILSNRFLLSRCFHGLDGVFLGFRVTAPAAPEHASFQKNNGADAVPVMDGKFLYIKYPPFCLLIIFHLFLFSALFYT